MAPVKNTPVSGLAPAGGAELVVGDGAVVAAGPDVPFGAVAFVVVLAGAEFEVVEDDDDSVADDDVVVWEAARSLEPPPEQAPAQTITTTSRRALARPVTSRTAPRP